MNKKAAIIGGIVLLALFVFFFFIKNRTKGLSGTDNHIYYRGRYINVNPELPPKDIRMLESFIKYNQGYLSIVRQNGGYYVIQKDGKLRFIARALYELSLNSFLEESKKI